MVGAFKNDGNIGYDFVEKVQSASKNVSDAVSNFAESTHDADAFATAKVNDVIEEKNRLDKERKQRKY